MFEFHGWTRRTKSRLRVGLGHLCAWQLKPIMSDQKHINKNLKPMKTINKLISRTTLARTAGASVAALAALAIVALSPSGPVGSARAAASPENTQLAEIHLLQAAFHETVSHNGDSTTKTQHLDALAQLWADDATLTVGTVTYTGKDAILAFWSNGAPLNNNWVSLAPTFRTEVDIHGDIAEIYFECYFVNAAGNIVLSRSISGTLKKVDGSWLFWRNLVAPPATPLF